MVAMMQQCEQPATTRIHITVDDRERRCAVPELLESSVDFTVIYRRLSAGDYLVDNRFLFERKALPDLMSSIVSGRLFKQALRLVENTDYQPALILEGTSRDLNGSEMKWEAIQGALITVTLLIGLPILRARTAEETMKTIRFAARQGRALAHGALPRRGARPKGKTALQNHVLQGLPGIGPERASRLIERFGNVRTVLLASEDDLVSVTGIGRQTAQRIAWAVQENAVKYGATRTTRLVRQ